ncbi:MAG: UDP-N-acetylmuramoyl-tripeptide--D-alanyl-D-alanine ligase [Muribaculaceae bacterium]
MDILTIFTISLIIIAAVDLYFMLHRDLMMLQQNSYRADRYTRWMNSNNETTAFRRIFAVIALFVTLVTNVPNLLGYPIAAIISVWNIFDLIFAKYKKPLVFTKRAVRLMCTALGIAAIIAIAAYFLSGDLSVVAVTLLAMVVLSPIVLLAAHTVLRPVENAINRGFYRDAEARLKSMPNLKIIGITGSYGKTSTKHYLNRILSEHFDVMMTPGSFNTTLGVIRTVREYLKPYNEVFIVEMGAKQLGDIKEICDLVHPSVGIITAVGEQHLESFKSIENVQKTKFELADSLPADGFAVVNNDFPYIANRQIGNVPSVRYSVSDNAPGGYHAENISYSSHGATFTLVTPDSQRIDFSTPLLGECNISNLIAAIAVAIHLGEPVGKIQYAVSHIEQVEHRLSRKVTPAGITIIDDAFNSNPDGSRMALDVLRSMTGGKRIVITPGMVELGDRQYELNKAFGAHIAQCADVAIIVGKYNREAIVEGIKTADFDDSNLFTVDTFAQAQATVSPLLSRGDTVLYENDLPDTYK